MIRRSPAPPTSARTTERMRCYLACGLTPRLARKKDRIVRACERACERGDRRAISKWMHANTRFDTTNVNGPWSLRDAEEC